MKIKLFNNKQKTNEISYFSYKIDSFNEEIARKLLENEQLNGGIVGLEALYVKGESTISIYTPSYIRLDYPVIVKIPPPTYESVSCFELEQSNSTFLPIYSMSRLNLFDYLAELEVDLYIQFVISKHNGKHRDKLINQYESYLQGNDSPVVNPIVRKLQSKVINVLDKVTGYSNVNVANEDIEKKILDQNYRMEMRMMCNEEDAETVKKGIKNLFTKANYYNELNLYEVNYDSDFKSSIEQRFFMPHSKHISYSKSELLAIVCTEEVSLNKAPIVQKSTVLNTQVDNLIEIFPPVPNRIRNIDASLGKTIEKAFQRVGLTKNKIKILKIEQGATLQRLCIEIPANTSYMHIEKNLKNIQATLGRDSLSVEIGDIPDTINLYLPCDNREVVYLRSILESGEYQTFAEEAILPFVTGEDSIGEPVYADLHKLVHILVAGATGSGKSVFLNSLILSLLLNKNPDELHLYLIDPKQVELGVYEGVPHVKSIISDMDKAYNTFASLINEMEKRYTLFADSSCRNLEQYNKSHPKLPYIVTVVDEYADLIDTHKEVESLIKRLGQKARAAGIHLIIATQRPSVDVITGVIKSNLPTKFCLRLNTSTDYKTVFGKGIPFNLLGNGDGVAAIEGHSKEFIRFQSPVISLDDKEVEEILDKLKLKWGKSEDHGMEIVEQESEKDKLKRMIQETGETRISELRQMMGIRINLVSDMMKELVEEGWLEKQGKSYAMVNMEDGNNKEV